MIVLCQMNSQMISQYQLPRELSNMANTQRSTFKVAITMATYVFASPFAPDFPSPPPPTGSPIASESKRGPSDCHLYVHSINT